MRQTLLPVVLAALAVGVGLGWLLFGRERPVGAGASADRVRALEQEVAALQEDLAKAKAAAATQPLSAPSLEGRPEETPAPTAGLAPAGTPPPANPRSLSAPRFAISGFEDVLNGVDWSVIGGNASAMVREMPHLADALSGKTDLSPEVIGRIQTLNGPLVTAALKFQDRVKGLDPNGAFTHPAFMSNAIVATLEAAGLPLSVGQQDALEDLGQSFTAEETRRLASYDDKAYALQKLVDEALLRDRFFDAAFALLTQEQRAALVKPEHRGHVALDLFSSGILWQAHVGKVTFDTVDDLVAGLLQRLSSQLELALTDVQAAELRQLLQDWLREWPAAVLSTPADDLTRAGLAQTTFVSDCARRQVALLGRMVPALGLDAAAAGRVQRFQVVYLPAKNP